MQFRMNKALSTTDVLKLIKKDNYAWKTFLGVFPIDMLPIIKKYPASAIINTDPSYMSGEHWIAFYIDTAKRCVFFDSYGGVPSTFDISGYLSIYKYLSIWYKWLIVNIQ